MTAVLHRPTGLLASPVGAVACARHAKSAPDVTWRPLTHWHKGVLERFADRTVGCEACAPRPLRPRLALPSWLRLRPQMP